VISENDGCLPAGDKLKKAQDNPYPAMMVAVFQVILLAVCPALKVC